MSGSRHASRFSLIMILLCTGCGGAALAEDADAQDLELQDGEIDAVDLHQDDPVDPDPVEAQDTIPDQPQEPLEDAIPDAPGDEGTIDMPEEDAPVECSDMTGLVQNPDIWILEDDVGFYATFELSVTNPNPAGGSCAIYGIAIDAVTVNRGSDGTEITTLWEVTPTGAPLASSLDPGESGTASYEGVDPYMSPVSFCGTEGSVRINISYTIYGGAGRTLPLSSANATINCV
jgi:hypothetical protein